MRLRVAALGAAATLLAAPGAFAAPTCLDRNGDTIRCGTPGAMPVGWSPSPQQLLDRQAPRSAGPTADELLGLMLAIGGLFALIALLPKFDGDWDQQGQDDEDRR